MNKLFEYKKALEDAYKVKIELGKPHGCLMRGFLMQVTLTDEVIANVENLEVPLTDSLMYAFALPGPLLDLPAASKIHLVMSSPFITFIGLTGLENSLAPQVVLSTHYERYSKDRIYPRDEDPLFRFINEIRENSPFQDRPLIERNGVKYLNGPAYYIQRKSKS